MENQLTISKKFSLMPSSLAEAIKYSEIISNSDIVPKDFKGKPGNVLVAVQMGAELGLSPLQALQNIAIINGKGSIWGDAALAIVQNHPDYEGHEEFIEGEEANMRAICRVKRKGSEWHEVVFDVEKAKKANLWGKAGPWTQYPERMLQMRARGFAIRDKFSDALKGLITTEEAKDYIVINHQEDPYKKNKESIEMDNVGILDEIKDVGIVDPHSQQENIKNLVNGDEKRIEKICNFYNVTCLEDLSGVQCEEILNKITRK